MRPEIRAAVPAVVLALAAAACSTQPPAERPARGPATSPGGAAAPEEPRTGDGAVATLRAVLTTPTDIDLSWRGGDPGASGHVLEFATDEAGPYTVLQYLPPGVTTYRHPDLMPRTAFFYRLRTFDGPASAPVDVALPPGELTTEDQESDHDWLAPRSDPGRSTTGRSVRDGGPAAPSGLKAEVKHANGILFTWTDHASDEEGFLLEARTRGGSAYAPVAVLDPDINSCGLITLPPEKRASYRVRAFTYGARSNVPRLTTGEPAADQR
ncbi:fibronectin type III domain-containing protein [Streptomyces scopuliridis]|uniref:fibronectin type III domain-containing protein n=1 Tax=Streptomyces scopuliridis TaxID=452529 RepID=UPI002DD96A24|nr:fibronectin type III domain-containing protein [Streptomyces scopuliridis]WSB37836.1 fibronectin type III domain-containing protein [Streptomyces scopuliridis]